MHHIIWTTKCCCFLSLHQAPGPRPTHTTSQSAATQTQHKSGATWFSPNHDGSDIIELHYIFSTTLLTIPGDVWFFFTPLSLSLILTMCVCVCVSWQPQGGPAETNTHTHTQAHTRSVLAFRRLFEIEQQECLTGGSVEVWLQSVPWSCPAPRAKHLKKNTKSQNQNPTWSQCHRTQEMTAKTLKKQPHAGQEHTEVEDV